MLRRRRRVVNSSRARARYAPPRRLRVRRRPPAGNAAVAAAVVTCAELCSSCAAAGGRAGEDLENFGGHLANLIARCERAGRRKRGRRGGDLVRGRAVPDRTASSQESTRGDSGLQTEGRTDPDHERLQRRPLATRAETWRRAARRPSPSNGWFDLYSYVRGAGQSIALRPACLPSQRRSALRVGSQHRLATPPPPLTYTLAPSVGSPLQCIRNSKNTAA